MKPPETKAPEASSTEAKQTEPKAEPKKEEKAPAGAPETYELKAPEGFEFDAKALEEVTPILKELNIPQEGAQRLADFFAKQNKDAAEAPVKFYNDMRAEWRKEIDANPKFKDQAAVKATIGRALDQLNNPELVTKYKEAMDFTGAGDNPAFVEVWYEMAKMLTEGTHVAGKGPAPSGQTNPSAAPKSLASAMFPHLK